MSIIVDPNTCIEQRPSAPWTLITRERKDFRNRIGEMRFPTCLNFDGKG